MNANQLITKLTWAKVDSRYATDARKVIQGEREALALAVRSGNSDKIARAVAEAKRVAEMWGVTL